MIRRVPHLTLALIALAAMVAPTALAGGGKPKKHHGGTTCVSAQCVYHELGLPSGKKGPPLSSKATAALQKHGGAQARALAELGQTRAFGAAPPLPGQAASVGHVGTPGALLAIFDLGAGPIALFVTLLAGATAFGVGGVLRRRRNSSAT